MAFKVTRIGLSPASHRSLSDRPAVPRNASAASDFPGLRRALENTPSQTLVLALRKLGVVQKQATLRSGQDTPGGVEVSREPVIFGRGFTVLPSETLFLGVRCHRPHYAIGGCGAATTTGASLSCQAR